ncbi:MAG: LemA family protein [Gammaproteobacteria bacterium]|nr:LemA family protein [Gammaproteobacteria bacterium]
MLMALIAFLVWGVFIYNRLVGDKNRVLSAWSDIDVQLKRRHDLIPKLVDAVRHYAAYESATLTEVTELRARSRQSDSIAEIGGVESQLAGRVRDLVALAEDYPDLKADDAFLTLQKDLTDVENTIQYARRYYNGAVRMLNTRIDSFPDTLVAGMFRFIKADYFEIDDATERESPPLD